MSPPNYSKLQLPDDNFIAYHRHEGKRKSLPGIIFLGGFRSDMTGTKAITLEKFCMEQGLDFIRFDYFGHGASSGEFERGGCIGRWKNDALAVLDNLANRPQILVGSSMGGWLMLLAALERPDKIAALVGIAAAPDFTETLIWNPMAENQKSEIMEKGIAHIPSDECGTYPITRELIEDGREHLLLHDRIPINCPVHLIHGMRDEDVPYQTSVRLAEIIESEDVQVILQKSGGHRMSEEGDLELILRVMKELLERFPSQSRFSLR